MTRFTIIGLVLSGLALALLVYLVYDCFTRADDAVASVRLGALEIGPSKIRWLWAVLLVVGFAAGVYGYPVLQSTDQAYTRDGGSPMVQPASRVERTIRLPFWVSRVTREFSPEGRRISTARREQLQVPWIFLLAGGLYWIGVGSARSPAASGRRGREETVSA